MKPSLDLTPMIRPFAFRALVAVAIFGAAAAAQAAPTDLASVPMQTSVKSKVRPNLLYTLDDSGSMGSNYLPDYVINDGNRTSSDPAHCRSGNPTVSRGQPTVTACDDGDVPFYSSRFNGVYYNPAITYLPPVKWDGTSFPAQDKTLTTDWTAVQTDPFTNPSNKTNLAAKFPEAFYCRNNTGSGANDCKRNGINTTNSFYYWTDGSAKPEDSNAVAYPKDPTGSNNDYLARVYKTQSAPFYYEIEPQEHCSDANLQNCVLSTTPTATHPNPAYVRFCRDQRDATDTAAVSDPVTVVQPKCIGKYVSQSGISTAWKYARYGKFKRVDIVSSATFPKKGARPDCAGAAVCTYEEEMTNFANWSAYYRTRILMMKTASGLAFQTLDDRYRVGFITIHPGSPVTSDKFLPVRLYDNTHKKAFFDILYKQTVGDKTPLREALSRAGRYFAKVQTGINDGIKDDPMEYSCQQNFVLLTTDGYWNEGDPRDLKGNNLKDTDVDNTNKDYAKRSDGAYDGAIGAKGSLADTALYYYQTDLRDPSLGNCTSGATGADVCKDNVPTSTRDSNEKQHISLFTLGLVDGLMKYDSKYDTSISGDVAKIKSSSTNCYWATGVCNWPKPAENEQSALDDLWHAAVNGRGKYFFADNPTSLGDGLGSALAHVDSVTAAAAAAATSTPNITKTDNFVFSTTYRTEFWDGEVVAQNIDSTTGNVIPAELWKAQTKLDGASFGSRKIYFNGGGTLTNFTFGGLGSLQSLFAKQGLKLSQWTDLVAADQLKADDGNNLVDFLRGDRTNEGAVFRAREHLFGDTVNATPAYVAKAQFQFGDAVTPDYASYKVSTATRQAMLYVGANDGMMHALNATTGVEAWAYVPTMVMENMYLLADKNYAGKHKYFVDGSATVMDAFIFGGWRTVLVGGLNGGGRGVYALDITKADAPPTLLWEICHDDTICPGKSEANIGFTYGNPVVTKISGKWVVMFTSGYNNISPGDGRGWLFVVDLETGAFLYKLPTTAGDSTTPSGLAKITALANNFMIDNTALQVYGGDLFGNVWKFDFTATPSVIRLALLTNGGTQPITTKPEVTKIGTDIVVYVTTGAYLGVKDLASTQRQTVYAFKDTGAYLGDLRANANIVSNTPTSGTDVTISNTVTVDWSKQLGWRVDLPQNGERVNIDPQLIQGTLLVVSNVPDADACSTGGESFFYQFDYLNPRAVQNASNTTLLGSRIGSAVAVGLTVIKLPSGAIKAIIPLADTTKQTLDVKTGAGGLSTRRIGWRQLRNR